MVSTTAVPVQAKILLYILISLPEKEFIESANYFEEEPSLLRRGSLWEIEYWEWECDGARGTVFPAHFRFSLSPAYNLPAYEQSSTKETAMEERERSPR